MIVVRPPAIATLIVFGLICAAPAQAQDEHAGHVAAAPQDAAVTPEWQWTVDSNAFFGFNYQYRKFRDFNAWESQNWLMATARRDAARGTIVLSSTLSLEALTLPDIGSPQVFQTGETFRRAPLIDYQHPHDLFMGLGAEYRRMLGRVTVSGGLDLVGSPTLGPSAFMHRPSASENPQAPLSHHYMDSTHTFHRHRQSQVGALTIGYVRDVLRTRAGGFGAGADVTGYLVPSNLKVPYGSPVSFHLFLRYRAPRPPAGAPVHVH